MGNTIDLNRPANERLEIDRKFKFLKVSQLRDLEQMLQREEITYSRMVELINELAYDFYMKSNEQE